MPKPMEGPFAEKLGKALQGHDVPRVSREPAVVTEGLDLSGGGKSGRQKGRERHERREKREKHDGEGVSGTTVHTRGHLVETASVEASPESSEHQEGHEKLVALVDEINTVDERLQILFQEYPDLQLTMTEVGEGGKKSDIDARIVATEAFATAGRDAMAYENAAGSISPEDFEQMLTNLSASLAEMQEVENRFREAAKLPKIERTIQNKGSDEASRNNPGPESDREDSERRPYASFDHRELREIWYRKSPIERITMVSDQLKEWQTFDQTIREFGDEERFKDDLKARGLGDRYDEVLRLTGRSTGVTSRIKGIQKEFKEKGELDQKEAAFLKAIFFGYHELLAVAEGIVTERERETLIVTAENEARAKRSIEEELARKKAAEAASQAMVQAVAPERVPTVEPGLSFEGKLSKLTDLLGRWNALSIEFDEAEFTAAIARVRKKEIPPIKDLEGWLAKKTTPESWNKQDRRYIEEDVLPEMERLIRQAERAAKKLRATSSAAAETVIPVEPKEPVAKVIGLDGREIERDETGELNQTEWQRMNPVEQNRLRTLLFQRRNEYLTRANIVLKKNGIERAIDRQKMVRERLEAFMLKVIEREITTVKLTEADRQSLLKEYSRDTEAFFAQ